MSNPIKFGHAESREDLRDAGPVFLTAAQVAMRIGVTERTLREWVRRGTWPPPTVFSSKTKRWHISVIQAAFTP